MENKKKTIFYCTEINKDDLRRLVFSLEFIWWSCKI
jgi:hypothetical protein